LIFGAELLGYVAEIHVFTTSHDQRIMKKWVCQVNNSGFIAAQMRGSIPDAKRKALGNCAERQTASSAGLFRKLRGFPPGIVINLRTFVAFRTAE